ncbi:MAG TPA: hypothetical protein VFU21_09340 [Kofleriaceae bacterium]|nr:hypothetical protein [Kofleriaceae bacterium]
MTRSPAWLLVLAAAACGSGSAPAPAARASGGQWLASRPVGAGNGTSGPGRRLDRFAARLSALAIAELSARASDAEAPCRGVMPPFRVLSALSDSGEDVSCLVGQGGEAVCVNFVDHDVELAEQALCGESGEQVDVPARVREAAAAADPAWRVAPIPAPEGVRALSLRAGNDYHLLVRRGSSWIASPLPVARTDGHAVGPERLLDSRALTENPSFALISSSLRGSAQTGELTTRLLILGGEDLAERTVRDIGLLVWTTDPDEKTQTAQGAPSFRAGPHLEVLLEPSITGDGALRLDLIREHRPEPDRRRFERPPCTPGGEGDLLGLACPVHRVDLIEKDAGFWRFKDGSLVRNRH